MSEIRNKVCEVESCDNEIVGDVVGMRKAGDVKEDCSGSDWGIVWWKAVIVILLVMIVVPLIYYLHFRDSFSNSSSSSTPHPHKPPS